jgi:CubicO group peptidase (beta-lactamase class C family)
MRIPSSLALLVPFARPVQGVWLSVLIAFGLSSVSLFEAPSAAESPKSEAPMTAPIEALIPELEAYLAKGMNAFDVPGLAIGIVTGDRLVYGKGFGVRRKGGAPVDTRTVFQIGSTTKAFLATTMAIMVDRGKLEWDDRIVDLDPTFQLKDPWVTREFRLFDVIAQRSGLPPYANDNVGILGADKAAMIRSLRYVEPVSSFRSTFAYTNITHLLAARIVAKAGGAPEWHVVAQKEILDPLGMKDTSFTAEAISAAANRTEGYRWTPNGTIEVPFNPIFPYGFGAAGNINSTIEDLTSWVRLQLGNGTFEGEPIVSPENLAITRTPKVAITDKVSYALGWIVQQTPNGSIVWHNGGTDSFGSYVGMLVDKDVGVIVLTNEENVGFPDAIGAWVADRLLDNPPVDHVANYLDRAKTRFEAGAKLFVRPENPRPFPPLAPLAGSFANPSFGMAEVRLDGDALVMELEATGAQLKLAPWDGEVFTASLVPLGRFAAIAEDLGPRPSGFVQFQIDQEGKLGVLRLSFEDGQAYEFERQAEGEE